MDRGDAPKLSRAEMRLRKKRQYIVKMLRSIAWDVCPWMILQVLRAGWSIAAGLIAGWFFHTFLGLG